MNNKLFKLAKILKKEGFIVDAFNVYLLSKKTAEEDDYYEDDELDEDLSEELDSRTLLQKAIDEFGITYDFNEGGYLLPDGSMLDFSGKNQGGPSGQRSYDHRQIVMVMDNPEDKTPSDQMDDFMKETGAIRISLHNDYILFDMETWPTREQIEIIKDFAKYYNISSIGISVPGSRKTEVFEPPNWREIASLIA